MNKAAGVVTTALLKNIWDLVDMPNHYTYIDVYTSFTHDNTLSMFHTFVIVECNVHSVSAYTDGSEASFVVRVIIGTIEKFKGPFQHIILA